jgi:hypothetical protein
MKPLKSKSDSRREDGNEWGGRKARASSTHSKRWREFVHCWQIWREAFGVRSGSPALSRATLNPDGAPRRISVN